MADNELKIIFGAETTQAVAGINKLQSSLAGASNAIQQTAQSFSGIASGQFQAAFKRISDSVDASADAAIKAGKSFEGMGRAPLQSISNLAKQVLSLKNNLAAGIVPEITLVRRQFEGLPKPIDQAASSMKKIVPGANQADNALLNLSRVAQDAPFGFIGITNNINPLLESFQRLKRESGSAGGALKALVGSLAGGGGLGLAVGIGSALLTVFGDKLFSAGKKAKEAKEANDEYAKSVQSAASEVGKEAARVTELVNALQSGTLERRQVTSAIKELQRINVQYFGDLDKEKNLVGALDIAYRAYLSSLEKTAKAKFLNQELAKLFEQKFKLELSLDEDVATAKAGILGKDMAKSAQDRFAKRFSKDVAADINKDAPIYDAAGNFIGKKIEEGFQKVGVIDLGGQTKKAIDRTEREIEAIQKILKEVGSFDITPELKDPPKAKQIKVKVDELEILPTKVRVRNFETIKNLSGIGEAIEIEVPFRFSAEPVSKINTSLATIGKDLRLPVIIAPKFDGTVLSKALLEFGATLETSLKGLMDNVAVAIGEGIGNILSGAGGAADLMGSIFVLIGDFIMQIGKALVTLGGVKKAVDAILKSFIATPAAVVIGLGVAAIAVGAFIKTAFKPKKFAEGGIVTGPTYGLIGEAGPEVIFPLADLKKFLGGDNGRGPGGSSNPSWQIAGVLRGQDVLLMVNRAEKHRNTIG